MIRVLVVDDSALIRALLSEIIQSEPDLDLVGAAPNAYVARDMVNEHAPDVITLDVEMPKVDGLTFLAGLMKARPTPVLMISTLTEGGADVTLRALELGAIDYISKPKIDIKAGIAEYQEQIVAKIKSTATARIRYDTQVQPVAAQKLSIHSTEKIIAVGASTGGTEAIKTFLMQLPANCPAVVITQHMPSGFTTKFAERLNGLCSMTVREAKDGERLLPGHAYLAPGDFHLRVERSGADYVARLSDDERVSGHKPSVDVMFSALADSAGQNIVAVLMTGMGKDGAHGMQKLFNIGAFTLAQDEATCVVFGMPKEAIRLGVVHRVCALEELAPAVLEQLSAVEAGTRV